ncbi:hypothetical protein [Burkholderia vietnamiensis]|uniref:hypothetical protein n=1 Tax=Burkholderia vietnamiensis TaxID=60552 RepID=UPI00158B7C11|nr:hypothetical protein [Burkholderia vietnamiensis]
MKIATIGIAALAAATAIIVGLGSFFGSGAKLTPRAKADWASAASIGLVKEEAPAAASGAQYDLAYAILATKRLRRSMRDPDSFKLESAFAVAGSGDICYQYRARNGFGGMEAGAAIVGKRDVVTDNAKSLRTEWGKRCAGKAGEDLAPILGL